MTRALALLVLAAATAALAADPCPASGSARLGRTVRELDAVVLKSVADADERCVLTGIALADFLDREGAAACPAEERLDGASAGDADLLALRSALLWRCGRPRAAFDAARAALAVDERATLAWRVLGDVLEARFMDHAAQAAYARALALDPDEAGSLSGLSRVTPDRTTRRATLEHYLAVGLARGEPEQNVRSARETIDFLDALGSQPLWVVEKADLPGELALDPIIAGLGRIRGWITRVELGDERRVPVLLDSGASGLHLDPSIAKRAGITPLAGGTLMGGGGSGEHTVERGTLPRLVVGPITFRSALGVVAGSALEDRGAYKAMLGLDVLGGTRVRFDPRAQRLAIHDADAGEQTDDPLQADPWSLATGELPLLLVDGQLLLPVTLRTPEGAGEFLALLDTGAAGSLLDEAAADMLGATRRGVTASARGYGGAIGISGVLHTVSIEIGTLHETVRDIAVIDLSLRARLAGVHVGGYVGEDVWSKHGFELDLARGTFRPLR